MKKLRPFDPGRDNDLSPKVAGQLVVRPTSESLLPLLTGRLTLKMSTFSHGFKINDTTDLPAARLCKRPLDTWTWMLEGQVRAASPRNQTHLISHLI